MEMRSTPVGGASPLSMLADDADRVELVVDSQVMAMTQIACPAATPNDYLRLPSVDLFNRFLPAFGISPVVLAL